jgi:hypothetical protein
MQAVQRAIEEIDEKEQQASVVIQAKWRQKAAKKRVDEMKSKQKPQMVNSETKISPPGKGNSKVFNNTQVEESGEPNSQEVQMKKISSKPNLMAKRQR